MVSILRQSDSSSRTIQGVRISPRGEPGSHSASSSSSGRSVTASLCQRLSTAVSGTLIFYGSRAMINIVNSDWLIQGNDQSYTLEFDAASR